MKPKNETFLTQTHVLGPTEFKNESFLTRPRTSGCYEKIDKSLFQGLSIGYFNGKMKTNC